MKNEGYYEATWHGMEVKLRLQIFYLAGALEEAEKGGREYVQAYLKGRISSLGTVLRHVRDVIETERNGI